MFDWLYLYERLNCLYAIILTKIEEFVYYIVFASVHKHTHNIASRKRMNVVMIAPTNEATAKTEINE